jgi:hypothetical protein
METILSYETLVIFKYTVSQTRMPHLVSSPLLYQQILIRLTTLNIAVPYGEFIGYVDLKCVILYSQKYNYIYNNMKNIKRSIYIYNLYK